MIDDNIRSASRQAAANDDPAAHIALLLARRRAGEANATIEALRDREAWNRAPAEVQDLAAREVAERIGEAWQFSGMRVWEAPNLLVFDEYDAGPGNTMTRIISHRLALFAHRATGAEFSLVPGRDSWVHDPDCPKCPADIEIGCRREDRDAVFDGVPPLLVARWPVTRAPHFFGDFDERGNWPMTGLSHSVVASWCKQNAMRLPSASEWEHCGRAGTTTRFYWGEDLDDSHCWHAGNSGDVDLEINGVLRRNMGHILKPDVLHRYADQDNPRPHAPAEHDAAGRWNAFGLVDCIGNVWEWLADHHQMMGGAFDMAARGFDWGATGTIENDMRIGQGRSDCGFRPIADIPGWGEVAQ